MKRFQIQFRLYIKLNWTKFYEFSIFQVLRINRCIDDTVEALHNFNSNESLTIDFCYRSVSKLHAIEYMPFSRLVNNLPFVLFLLRLVLFSPWVTFGDELKRPRTKTVYYCLIFKLIWKYIISILFDLKFIISSPALTQPICLEFAQNFQPRGFVEMNSIQRMNNLISIGVLVIFSYRMS